MRENCIRKVTLTFQSTQTWDCRVPGPSGESTQSPVNTDIALVLLKVKSARILVSAPNSRILLSCLAAALTNTADRV